MVIFSISIISCSKAPEFTAPAPAPKVEPVPPVTVGGFELEDALTGEVQSSATFEMRGLVGSVSSEHLAPEDAEYSIESGVFNE